MKLERFKVEENPTILGFDIYASSPYTSVSIHHRILAAFLPLVERLAAEKEELYRAARQKLVIGNAMADSKRLALDGTSAVRNVLPFNMSVTGLHSDEICRKVTLPKSLVQYVESIVLEVPTAKLSDTSDPLTWYPSQFSPALDIYISYSLTRDDVDDKIIQLWNLYGPNESRPDLRAALLNSAIVKKALWTRPKLTQLVLSWLPEYPISNPSGHVDFKPQSQLPPNLPRIPDYSYLILDETWKATALDALTLPFSSYGRYSISLRHLSRNAANKLTILAIAWILTVLEVPRDIPLPGSSVSGPVAYAIRNVRVDKSFLEQLKTGSLKDSPFLCVGVLNNLLPTLPVSEVDLLAHAAFSAPKNPTNDAMIMSIFGYMRCLGIPRLASEQAFKVLEDVDASSWHRQAITPSTLCHCQPQAARDLLRRMITYTQEQHRQQQARQRERRRNKNGPTVQATEEEKPLLKMSTHKMVLQLLQTASLQGSIDTQFIEKCAAEGLLETPPAIRSFIVDVLTTVVQDLFIINGDARDTSGMWEILSPFVDTAQRLSEDIALTDEQWNAARARTRPMPDIEEERHIASSLLSNSAHNIPSSLKRAWAEKVVYPVITGHVRARTKWLRTAIAREGGSQDLEESAWAICGSGMPVATSFQTFANYLPEDTSLLDILERDVLGFLLRPTCQKLLDLMEKNHKPGWERETYGKNVKLLTDFAVSDGEAAGVGARSSIHSLMVKPNSPSTLVNSCSRSLQRIGVTLLRPENAQVHTNLQVVTPYSSFRRFIDQTLAPVSAQSLHRNVVDLLSRFLSEVESAEKRDSASTLNGGASYWSLVIILTVCPAS